MFNQFNLQQLPPEQIKRPQDSNQAFLDAYPDCLALNEYYKQFAPWAQPQTRRQYLTQHFLQFVQTIDLLVVPVPSMQKQIDDLTRFRQSLDFMLQESSDEGVKKLCQDIIDNKSLEIRIKELQEQQAVFEAQQKLFADKDIKYHIKEKYKLNQQ